MRIRRLQCVALGWLHKEPYRHEVVVVTHYPNGIDQYGCARCRENLPLAGPLEYFFLYGDGWLYRLTSCKGHTGRELCTRFRLHPGKHSFDLDHAMTKSFLVGSCDGGLGRSSSGE